VSARSSLPIGLTGTPEDASPLEDAGVALVREHLAERRGPVGASIRVSPLSGDASTRRYFRLAGPEGTEVLSLYPEPFSPEDLPFLGVRSLLSGWGLPTPQVLDHDGRRGVVVQEDLGDLTLQEALKSASDREREALYGDALDDLCRLQRASVQGSHRLPCFQIAFDIEKLSWELHYFQKHFLEGLLGRDLTVEDRSVLSEGFHRLSEEIASWPRVLCHRDFHSRNLMRHRGRLYWIDFQDARMGPATYDLASLLRDSYVDLDEDFVAERLEEFCQQASPGDAREVFERRFELTSVQRNLQALGTFGYMATVRGNDVYLPYVPRTLAHARRNLARHPELAGLRRVLGRHVEGLA
jgi:aminoglycoside/choline kinase family phosphotransferase